MKEHAIRTYYCAFIFLKVLNVKYISQELNELITNMLHRNTFCSGTGIAKRAIRLSAYNQ